MQLNPEYNNYYVYSSVYLNGELIVCGACPLTWEDKIILRGGLWHRGLTWADGNYHLYESEHLGNNEVLFIEECIYISINESEEISGSIIVEDMNHVVRWCIMDEYQINTIFWTY